jgi:hypothetical protein
MCLTLETLVSRVVPLSGQRRVENRHFCPKKQGPNFKPRSPRLVHVQRPKSFYLGPPKSISRKQHFQACVTTPSIRMKEEGGRNTACVPSMTGIWRSISTKSNCGGSALPSSICSESEGARSTSSASWPLHVTVTRQSRLCSNLWPIFRFTTSSSTSNTCRLKEKFTNQRISSGFIMWAKDSFLFNHAQSLPCIYCYDISRYMHLTDVAISSWLDNSISMLWIRI